MLLFLLLGLPYTLKSQQRQIVHDNEVGVRYLNLLTLNARWRLQTDIGYRWQSLFDQSSLYMLRSSGSFTATEQLRLAAGLGVTGYNLDRDVHSVEFRPYQEGSLSHRLWGFGLSHRVRVEERFIRTRADVPDNGNTATYVRSRYAFRLRLLDVSLSATHPARRFLLTLGEEVLLQGGGGDAFGFTFRNRLLLSPALELNPQLGLSLSYSHQSTPTAVPNVNRWSDVVWLVFRQRMGGGKSAPVEIGE